MRAEPLQQHVPQSVVFDRLQTVQRLDADDGGAKEGAKVERTEEFVLVSFVGDALAAVAHMSAEHRRHTRVPHYHAAELWRGTSFQPLASIGRRQRKKREENRPVGVFVRIDMTLVERVNVRKAALLGAYTRLEGAAAVVFGAANASPGHDNSELDIARTGHAPPRRIRPSRPAPRQR